MLQKENAFLQEKAEEILEKAQTGGLNSELAKKSTDFSCAVYSYRQIDRGKCAFKGRKFNSQTK